MDRVFFEQLAMPLFDQLYNHACWLTGDRTTPRTWCRRPMPRP